jgi:hypothetical protein
LDGVVEKDGGEYVCQVSTIGQLIATSFHLDIQGKTASGGNKEWQKFARHENKGKRK